MAPKKKEQQKMSLGAFLTDEKMGSWADEMEDMPVYSRTGYGGGQRATYNSSTGAYGGSGGYSVREELPLPDKPPYTVHLGNLSFDATEEDVKDFFADCECKNVRIIEDKMEMKPKGFGYAEFHTLDGLKGALALNGSSFQSRNIRISVADPPKDRDGRPEAREITDWTRKGPLPDLPGRGGSDRQGSGRGGGGFGGDFGGERRERTPYAGAEGDGKVRDFGNWERRGPLSPMPQQDRAPRDGGRPRTNDGPKGEGFRDRRSSPAAWGEGRPAPSSQDGGSRPPRREFQERPVAERAPTAADQDSQWRTKMKPDAPAAKSPVPSRDRSEAPSSPALGSAAPAPSTRPKLNLAKRTVTETPDQPSPTTTTSGKSNPFGGAVAVDTAARDRQVEEARLAALAEKKEAEEKAKTERAEAAKAKAAEAENQKATESEPKEILQRPEGEDVAKSAEGSENGTAAEKSTEIPARPKPAETGAWRRPSAGPPGPRDDGPPRGPRGGRGGRGGRGDGPGRGPRHFDEGRGGRQNSNGRISSPTVSSPAPPAAAAPVVEADPDAPADDGWSTVAKPKKNNRGGK